MSDVALRKKKNADAQAAFRARRANYISTLEETVTNLESVVIQLQDACREARTEVNELRQDNSRLRHEFREREKFWRALWQARKTGQGPDPDDLPPLPTSFSPSHTHSMASHMGPSHVNPYGTEALAFRTAQDPSSSLSSGPYATGSHHGYPSHTSVAYPGADNEGMSAAVTSHQMSNHRAQKYHAYSYAMHSSSRDGPWPHPMTQSASSGGESGGQASNNSSHSPGFAESPTLTSSEMSYVGRFPVDEQKLPISNLETAPYVFPTSRSLSPTTSTPPSSSSTSLTSPFQFTFPDNSITQDRPEYDFRRHSTAHGAEVTLHGGTADISLAGPGTDAVRYRVGARRTNSGAERPLLPAIPQFADGDNGSQQQQQDRAGSSEGESAPYSRLRPRRENTAASQTSRSPSPSTPPISGTLAVIKAQAFGALRRTRARTKKSSEGAAKVAMEVLEARGIGMGVSVGTGSKRPRLHDDNDMQA